MTQHQFPSWLARLAGLTGEFAFVTGAMLASMFLALVVLGGINPLESPIISGTWIIVTIIALLHHVWYQRHQAEILASHEHQHDRERRGF